MTLTLNDTLSPSASSASESPSSPSCNQCVKIAFTYNAMYQVLTPFLPSYFDKNLISPLKFRIFAPAIEGTAFCAEKRSSMKTGAGLK
jgi:hypothetical protein